MADDLIVDKLSLDRLMGNALARLKKRAEEEAILEQMKTERPHTASAELWTPVIVKRSRPAHSRATGSGETS